MSYLHTQPERVLRGLSLRELGDLYSGRHGLLYGGADTDWDRDEPPRLWWIASRSSFLKFRALQKLRKEHGGLGCLRVREVAP